MSDHVYGYARRFDEALGKITEIGSTTLYSADLTKEYLLDVVKLIVKTALDARWLDGERNASRRVMEDQARLPRAEIQPIWALSPYGLEPKAEMAPAPKPYKEELPPTASEEQERHALMGAMDRVLRTAEAALNTLAAPTAELQKAIHAIAEIHQQLTELPMHRVAPKPPAPAATNEEKVQQHTEQLVNLAQKELKDVIELVSTVPYNGYSPVAKTVLDISVQLHSLKVTIDALKVQTAKPHEMLPPTVEVEELPKPPAITIKTSQPIALRKTTLEDGTIQLTINTAGEGESLMRAAAHARGDQYTEDIRKMVFLDNQVQYTLALIPTTKHIERVLMEAEEKIAEMRQMLVNQRGRE